MEAVSLFKGIPVNPEVPDGFWSHTPIELRPEDHLDWLGKPFIQTMGQTLASPRLRYEVFCLDGEDLDRPAAWGSYGTLEEAFQRVGKGPHWGRDL